MNYLRNLLLTLTTVGAVLSFYIKVCRDFFIETVKSNYKNVPGKQSIFEIITVWVMYSSVIIYIVLVILFILTKGSIVNIRSTDSIIQDKVVYLIATTILLLFFNSLGCLGISFFKLRRYFIYKLEGKYIKRLGNKMRLWISVSIITSLLLFLLGIFIVVYYPILQISLLKEGRNFIFINTLSVDEIYAFATYGIISFIGLTFFIILNGMREIAKTINEKCTYIILTDTEEIACNSYLEYNEYYLVFRNGMQRYISKSKVKEIDKSVYYYKQDFNLKAH
ncbi:MULTISPECIES: hypothetical protein [Clostridium]|uniref:hypothetical protein n=1 Tax=Clostridium TaxID=1485 RepID=UPI000DEB7AF5|nr:MULTISPECIES: hypothetical protein [Clostridium]AXB83429.1 hypothetical protein DRB99_00195 [Clostridium butyricum]MDB2160494.1 hypothetical protein [Clostridium butyricum]MDU1231751.1 hypothetical protein [Clostridium sp.]MDU3091077.1 hypothetical protein [Clostridium sp.]MDU5104398.1 hypothetical protein [Clostridium butyricum]